MDIVAKTQDGGVSNTAITNLVGDGTALNVNLGFNPRYVSIINVTDQITYEWYMGMAATQTLKTVAAGTRTLDTTSAIVPRGTISGGSPRGFGCPAAVNLAGKSLMVMAHG